MHLNKKRTICKNLRACIHLWSCRIHAIDTSHHVCIIYHNFAFNNISSLVCAHKFTTLPETNSKSTWKWIPLECKPFLFGQKAYFHLFSRAKSSFQGVYVNDLVPHLSRSHGRWQPGFFAHLDPGKHMEVAISDHLRRKLGQPAVVIFYGFKNTKFDHDHFANGHLFVARLTYRYIPGRSGFHIFGECTLQQTRHG